ncbi:hypothetical protein BJ165DRAFT_1493425 [Panaeolus papilionaceus]|nr:hypothetical protein BJ165DRAFT_1493425 [Panaeolus papilionaceus]
MHRIFPMHPWASLTLVLIHFFVSTLMPNSRFNAKHEALNTVVISENLLLSMPTCRKLPVVLGYYSIL